MEISVEIVKRLQSSLKSWKRDITQKRMFGGDCFLYKGKMCVGEIKQKLLVRVLQEKMDTILKMPHVSPMDFTKKPMKEFVFVALDGFNTNEKLQYFVELGIEHAQSKVS